MRIKIKNYKGSIVESLRRISRRYPNSRIVEARQVGSTLEVVTKEGKFDGTPNSMQAIRDKIEEMKQTGADIERITEAENMVQRFTAEAIEKRRDATRAVAAATAEKKLTDYIDKDAKAMAELLGDHETLFLGVQDKTREVGVLLTRTVKVASQHDAYAELFEKLSDEGFVKANPELQDSAKNLIGLLEAARRTALRLNLIKEPEPVTTWKATPYDRDSETGKLTQFKEGFMDRVGGFFRKLANWFCDRFFPRYQDAEAQFVTQLEEYDAQLDGVKGVCEDFLGQYS